MTDHREPRLKFRAIACAGLLMSGMSVCSHAETNTLDWSIVCALSHRGATVPLDVLRVHSGAAFGPEIATGTVCFSRGQQAARARLVGNAERALGITWTPISLKPGAWESPTVRRGVRDLVGIGLRARDAVLVEGAWTPSDFSRQWGLVLEMDIDNMIKGTTFDGATTLRSAIETMAVMGTTNTSLAPGALRDATIAAAVRMLSGAPAQIEGAEDVFTGIAAVDWLADAAHRTPWCPACGKASTVCIAQFLKTWRNDALCGAQYLRTEAEGLAGPRAKSVRDAAQAIEEAAGTVTAFADESAVRACTIDTVGQAVLGERIRKASESMRVAAVALAQASDMTSLPTMPSPNRLVGIPASGTAAPWLPIFARMQDGGRPLLCSLLVAMRFADVVQKSEWTRAAYRNPFIFSMPTKPDAPLLDVPDEIDACHAVCAMGGCVPTIYTMSESDPGRVVWFMRRAIAESLLRGVPVVAQGIGASNLWGLIAGFEAGATMFSVRTPIETSKAYRVVADLPHHAVVVRKVSAPIADRDALLRIVRAPLATNDPPYAHVTGIQALALWRQRMRDRVTSGAVPTPAFAMWSDQIWSRLLEQRREAYQFLELAAQSQPDTAFELLTLRNIYVIELNALLIARADGYILHMENGEIRPENWIEMGAVRQIETIDRILAIENDAMKQLQVVVARLERKRTMPKVPLSSVPLSPIVHVDKAGIPLAITNVTRTPRLVPPPVPRNDMPATNTVVRPSYSSAGQDAMTASEMAADQAGTDRVALLARIKHLVARQKKGDQDELARIRQEIALKKTMESQTVTDYTVVTPPPVRPLPASPTTAVVPPAAPPSVRPLSVATTNVVVGGQGTNEVGGIIIKEFRRRRPPAQ